MSLSNKTFKTNYNSYEDDIVNAFYLKALTEASNYDRVSAFFDSKILSLYSAGIEKIYKNNGKIRFIFSQQLSEYDYKLMLDGYNERANNILINNMKISELSEHDKVRLSNLAFLIEKGIVDIKIAFTKSGILHDKFGLIYNKDDIIYFRGSNNETVAAIENNYESFEVSCSWLNQEYENIKIKNAMDNFSEMWNDSKNGMKVLEIPEIIKNEILKYSKGKIISYEEINYYDSLIADINENEVLIVKNNLKNYYDFDKDYDYSNFIKKHVESYDNKKMIFKDNVNNYVIIQKIINKFIKSSQYNNYNFVVSDALKEYIKYKNFEIDKRQELGKLIKNRDSSVYNHFVNFQTIVNEEMARELRDKQMWDSFFITKMMKSANYSVPGAGKTSIVYGAFAYLNSPQIDEVDKLLVVGPKNSFKSWKDEFLECFGPKKQLNLLNIQDSKYSKLSDRVFSLRFDSKNCNVILVNYDMLNNLSDVLNEIIDSRTMLVYDEVHKVKSIGGVWASAALKISSKPKYKVVLSGTPIPNSYADLYNQLNILFADEYRTYFKFTPNDLKKNDNSMFERVNEAIYPFFCRTTKKDLSIPSPNDDKKIVSPMSLKEQKLFSMIRKKYSKNGLAMYIRLLQASNNPKLLLNSMNIDEINEIFMTDEEEKNDDVNYIDEKVYKDYNYDIDEKRLIESCDMTTKFWDGIDLVYSLVKEKKQVIVWGIFIDTINRIYEELNKRGISSKIIYGATELNDREKIIDQFKNKEFDVLITNPHTLAESVSLHKTCHDAVYFEYSFNLTHMLQSKDRINRLGLDENQYTQYYYLFLRNDNAQDDSIDLKTYDRLKEKEQIMLDSVEGESIYSINFDVMDDIQRILEEN